jgi:hypothetical protein
MSESAQRLTKIPDDGTLARSASCQSALLGALQNVVLITPVWRWRGDKFMLERQPPLMI